MTVTGTLPEGVNYDYLLLDRASLVANLEMAGGVMSPIIKRNTAFPTKKSEISSTHLDNQRSVLTNVRVPR